MDLTSSDPNTAEIRSGIKPLHDKINETLFRKVGDKYIPAMVIDNLSGDVLFYNKSGDNQAARLDGSKGEFSFNSLKLPHDKVLGSNAKGITVNGSNIIGPKPDVHRVTGGVQIDGANGSEIVQDGAQGPKGNPGPKGNDVSHSVIQDYQARLQACENNFNAHGFYTRSRDGINVQQQADIFASDPQGYLDVPAHQGKRGILLTIHFDDVTAIGRHGNQSGYMFKVQTTESQGYPVLKESWVKMYTGHDLNYFNNTFTIPDSHTGLRKYRLLVQHAGEGVKLKFGRITMTAIRL